MTCPTKSKHGLILRGAGPWGKRHVKIFRQARLKMYYRGIGHGRHKRMGHGAGMLASFGGPLAMKLIDKYL